MSYRQTAADDSHDFIAANKKSGGLRAYGEHLTDTIVVSNKISTLMAQMVDAILRPGSLGPRKILHIGLVLALAIVGYGEEISASFKDNGKRKTLRTAAISMEGLRGFALAMWKLRLRSRKAKFGIAS